MCPLTTQPTPQYSVPPHSHEALKKAMFEFFEVGPRSISLFFLRRLNQHGAYKPNRASFPQVDNLKDMLPHLYKEFSKDFFASFALSVVACAKAGDALANTVLSAVGQRIGKAS